MSRCVLPGIPPCPSISVSLTAALDLKDVNLENCRKLTDASLDHLRKLAPKLQSFDIGGNFNMTLAGITKFIEKHPNHSKFTRVHISGHPVTDQYLSCLYFAVAAFLCLANACSIAPVERSRLSWPSAARSTASASATAPSRMSL